MQDIQLYQQILGATEPWHVESVRLDPAQQVIEVQMALKETDWVCPVCQGRGEIKTAQTVCYEILREVVREHRQFQARGYRILAAQQVIDLFLDEESHSLAMLADFVGKPVTLQVEAEYNQEQFDVVLL